MLIIARLPGLLKFGASNDVTLPLCNLWKPENQWIHRKVDALWSWRVSRPLRTDKWSTATFTTDGGIRRLAEMAKCQGLKCRHLRRLFETESIWKLDSKHMWHLHFSLLLMDISGGIHKPAGHIFLAGHLSSAHLSRQDKSWDGMAWSDGDWMLRGRGVRDYDGWRRHPPQGFCMFFVPLLILFLMFI